jgi:hypothetical protein
LEGILFDGSIKLVVIQKEEGRQPAQSDGVKVVSAPEVTPH